MMLTEIPPDIRYHHLIEEEEHGEGEEHPPYTDELIKRAITEGLDPAGEPLDLTMPRWQMSERDLDDLLGFLKTLD
jgi:cytochrome c oxidase subunit 2